MGIILGWLSLICFLGLLAKAVTRKLRLKKANMVFMKIHKPLSVAFLVFCLIHFLVVLPVFQTRAFGLYVTGIVIFTIAFLLIILCHTMKKAKDKQIKWHRILSAGILFFAIIHIVVYYVDFNDYKQKINDIEIEQIDATNIPDGKYQGEYDAGYIFARVEVTVAEGKIQDILLLEHKNERGSAAENILSDILGEQVLPVDAVSGATNSSKVIMKAVENALMEG